MAGIGFELKKIFEKNTISSKVRGYSYATIISVGPMIVSVIMLISIGGILKLMKIDLGSIETITTSIMYAYIFSLISVSGFVMVISRYISDKIYIEDVSDVLASLVGVISINLLLGGSMAILFFINSPLEFNIKLLSYMFFLDLSIIYILTAYISALKDYMRIVKGFGIGAISTILLSLALISLKVGVTSAILLGLVIGFLITILLLIISIKSFFSLMSPNVFSFVGYIFKMPYLFFINLLYTLGLFAHNFIMWKFSDISSTINDTYIISGTYDNATFFAILTIIPATVLFVVRVETAFYEKYKKFTTTLDGGGSLRDIEISKKEMINVLRRELINIMKMQFVATLLLIIFGTTVLLPALGKDSETIALFSLLSIGYYMTYMTFIVLTILLYFDNQEDALKIATMFFMGNIIFSYFTILLGREYYGLGLPISSLLSLIVGLHFLDVTLSNIDYRLFSKVTSLRNPK